MRTRRSERGSALIETAMALPIILLISVAIFEFGRAYQTWQVLTNAAREGARISVLPGSTESDVNAIVMNYMVNGALPGAAGSTITVNRNAAVGSNSASQVTVDYPFQFIVLQPVARLVSPSTRAGEPLTMRAVSIMRNETQ